jgi:peroxiredoxin
MIIDPEVLPEGLPEPEDDGATSHLVGRLMPALALPSTSGGRVRVDLVPEGADRLFLSAYPRTGRPGEPPLTADWDLIPGARGCTPESCGFRDHAAELWGAGAAVVGVSTQSTDDQLEVVERLGLPFPLLSDGDLQLTLALGLPTHVVAGHTLIKRLTLVVRNGRIEHVFYPVFPPDTHASNVLVWLGARPVSSASVQGRLHVHEPGG